MQRLFEAWDGLTVDLGEVRWIEHYGANSSNPEGILLNGRTHPNRTRADYERLRDAAMAYGNQATDSAPEDTAGSAPERCPACNGHGFAVVLSETPGKVLQIYCSCKMGIDLQRADARLAKKKAGESTDGV